jgi:hypothetical protein
MREEAASERMGDGAMGRGVRERRSQSGVASRVVFQSRNPRGVSFHKTARVSVGGSRARGTGRARVSNSPLRALDFEALYLWAEARGKVTEVSGRAGEADEGHGVS